jgi:hypothetical protein
MITTVRTLLDRGDLVAIKQGRLVISPESGKPIPDDWMKKHAALIINEVINATGMAVFRYSGYSTGQYGKHKAGGVTLQFTEVLNHKPAYLIFNASLVRDRNTNHGKKGSSLPEGQFRVGKQSAFVRFWESSGLQFPRRLSSFYDYMGKLEGIVFAGCYCDDEKLDKKTVQPLNLTHSQIKEAFSADILPDNSRTTSRQSPDNSRTRVPDKELEESHIAQSFQEDLTTGGINYGIKVKGNTGEGSYVIPLSTPINNTIGVEDQTVDQWLTAYGSDDG